MRWHLSILLALVATGCGTKTYHVDPQIQPYIDRFVKVSNDVGAPVTVDNLIASISTTAHADWAGQCQEGAGTPTIVIDAADWAAFSDLSKEQVVFHELGHCVLGRLHQNLLDAYEVPVSIMYHQMQWDSIYEVHKSDWYEEMFWYKGPEERN